MTVRKSIFFHPYFSIKTIFLVLPLCLGLFSCGKKVLYEKSKSIPEKSWDVNKPVKFDVAIEDTIHYYNFYITVRNTTDFDKQNLYIFLTTSFPNGKKSRDTVGCFLADATGRWLGKGRGFYRDNKYLLRKGIRFPAAGIYSFEMEQAMRTSVQKGIDAVGICIEPYHSQPH